MTEMNLLSLLSELAPVSVAHAGVIRGEPLEPPVWHVHLIPAIALLALMALYNFGIWTRNFVFPAANRMSMRKQLAAGIPAGLISMAVYGRTTIPGLEFASEGLLFDACLIAGNAILFGMMSRETLEKLMERAGKSSGLEGIAGK